MVVELKRETNSSFVCFLCGKKSTFSINSGVFFGFRGYIETGAWQMALNVDRGFITVAVLNYVIAKARQAGKNILSKETHCRALPLATFQSNEIFRVPERKKNVF